MVTKDIDVFPQIKFLLQYLEGHSGFIAGGCFKNIFNNERVKDIDIFFNDYNDFDKAVVFFENNKNHKLVYENANAVSFRNLTTSIRVELIKKIVGLPVDILNNFDFSITKFAVFTCGTEVSGKKLYSCLFHKDYFEHLMCKKLVIDDLIPFPISTFNRVLRYAKYGYTLCRESKVKLIEKIKQSEVQDIDFGLYDGVD